MDKRFLFAKPVTYLLIFLRAAKLYFLFVVQKLSPLMKLISTLLVITICTASAAQSKKVVQIDITALLNARPVTTLKKGKLTTWTKGIDGNGLADGYLTKSAASFVGDKEAHALPDEALIKG